MSEGTAVVAKRRGGARKVLGCIVLGVSLVVGARALWGRSEAVRRWAAMEKEVDAIKGEALRRGGPRPTFHKDPEPGNAWDDYGRALEELKRSRVEPDLAWTIALGSAQVQKSEIDALVKNSHPAMEHLRRGVRKAEACFPYHWDPLEGQKGKNDLGELHVGHLALCTVRHLRAAGDAGEALDLLLDTALFGRDLADGGWLGNEHAGIRLLETCCDEIRSMILSKSMGAGDCLRISQALETIEQGLPLEGLSTMRCVALMVSGRSRGLPWSHMFGAVKIDLEGPLTPGWGCGFSPRVLEVEAYERMLTVARRYASFGDGSWEEARLMEAEGLTLLRENGWAVLRPPSVLDRRHMLAHLRILRMAAHWLAAGEVRPLTDPFGPFIRQEKHLKGGERQLASLPPPLRTSQKGSTRKFWSAGPDGVDDGGTEMDLVLEVPR